eukprot:g5049.t1
MEETDQQQGAASIRVDLATSSGMAPSAVHHLPCSIKYDGPAPVSCYFRPTEVGAAGGDKRTVKLRGRELEGRRVALPAGVRGVVFREKSNFGATEDGERAWYVDSSFSEITYWTHDKLMSEHDHVPQAMKWLEHANALHAPLDVVQT